MFLVSAFDLIARVRNNLALLKKKGYYSNVEPLLSNEKHRELKFREATPQEKKRFLSKLKASVKRDRALEMVWIILAAVLFIFGLVWILKFIV